ncbi:MAG: CHAT domain-containing protein, partial [Proteobacteria bacterium]|nr:CHAT domain-containing protein [Pseudomonadota bacterium]
EVYQALIDALTTRGDSLEAMMYAQRLQLISMSALPVPQNDKQMAALRELAERERRLKEALTAELVENSDDELAGLLRQQLAELRVEFAATVDQLRSTYPYFETLVRMDPEDIESVQAELDPGVVVLQPLLFEDRLVLLVFRRDRLVPVNVTVSGEDVRRDIRQLTKSLRGGDIYDPRATRRLCERLGRWFWEPIAEELEDAEVLVVTAQGILRDLPFALLRRDDKYLVEEVAVAGVTHVGSLRRHVLGEQFRLGANELLLLGNPDGTLPGAEDEVLSITRHFPAATVLLGFQGTKENVLEAARDKSVIHLATHGVIDPHFPDQSYLMLHGSGDEGRLTYRQIPGLGQYLNRCRLVVLSACESSRPVKAEGNEATVVAINGLAAQFRRAGVETLVGSLWRVNDQGTQMLMDNFYKEMAKGKNVAQALQEAQQYMIANSDWSHPYFWASFVVMGDWR